MSKLPKEIKLTFHAQQRLEERNINEFKYYTKNIMKSSCRWYTKEDLIYDCALYRHCCYTTRKSNQIGYITDGEIEVIYNKNTKIAITILNVKDKFKPITQYIKPEILKQIETKKKERKEVDQTNIVVKTEENIVCTDCGKEAPLNSQGLCEKCVRRRMNAKYRGKEYIRYLDLPEKERHRIDTYIKTRATVKAKKEEQIEEPPKLVAPNSEGYYESKANQTSVETHPIKTLADTAELLQDQNNFVTILRDCGCEIPDTNLREILDVLLNTNKLKDILLSITKDCNQQSLLDLEQALIVIEKKLQHDWEYNGFQEEDDIKFKEFLVWRRTLKDAIFFWKKLYETNTLLEMQRAWESYTADSTDKALLAGDRINSTLKRYQITTESISTIFNTKKPFTRVFYATSQDKAYEMFVKWMADRQLHENKSKTVITELKTERESVNE